MEKWRGKYAIVTGTSSGIGVAIMKELAQQGVNVIALARRVEKIEEALKDFQGHDGKIFAHKCDVSSLESIKETFKWIEDSFDSISILVNNAGCGFNVCVTDTSDDTTEKLNQVIDTNFTGLVHMTREAIKLIKKSDDFGMIINVNSVVGHKIPYYGIPLNVYPPTKFAVTAFSEVLRQELVQLDNKKIRVTNLSPGSVYSDIAVSAGYAENHSQMYETTPYLDPIDIAEAIKYLLSTPTKVNVTELTIQPVGEV